MSLPKTQTAVFVQEIGKPLVVGTRDVPTPNSHQILVKVQSTMLLPHDTYGRDKGLFFGDNLPFILGTNIAGTVVSIGSAVKTFTFGDEVFGLGSPVSPVPDESGLQQYALLDAECSAKIPAGYDFDQLASIPVNAATSFSALFNENGFGFPMPGSKKEAEWDPKSETILVIGGGSNVGKIAIQYGKLIGLGKILTIASASNTSALKELGATHVIDRHQTSSEIQAQIKNIVGFEGLSKIYDCVSWEHDLALSLFSPDKLGILLGLHRVDEAKKTIAERKLNVKATLIIGSSSFMQPLTKFFWESLPSWVANGDLAIGKYKAIEGFNLPAIEAGLDLYRDGKPVTPVVVHPWGQAIPTEIEAHIRVGIFPASGALGTSTYTNLLSQVPNNQVTLINRYPEKVAKKYIENGVTVRQASYESTAEELEAVFAGVDVLFLISFPSSVHLYRTKVQTKALDAAQKAGVKHIFYSSLAYASIDADSATAEVMAAHLDSEAHLKKLARANLGLSWTSIREGLYTESYQVYAAVADLKNPPSTIKIPWNGKEFGISWAKQDELGEASARLIASYAKSPSAFAYTNKIVTLSGPKSWTWAETVEVLSRATGKDIHIQEVSLEEYKNLSPIKAYFGTGESANGLDSAWEAIRAGEAGGVTTTLGEILGRAPESFEKTIEKFVKG